MLSKPHRIRTAAEFRSISRTGKRRQLTTMVCYFQENPNRPARFGFIVSKTVGSSPTRNKVRRKLRAIASEEISNGFSGFDVVLRALPTAATVDYTYLAEEFRLGASRLKKVIDRGSN